MDNRVASFLCLSLCLFATSAAADNLVTNGSFEGATYTGPNGEAIPVGWTNLPVDNVSLSAINKETAVNPATFLGPEDGAAYVAFMSTETDGSQDCFYTTVNTVIGQQYTVSFWVAITAASVSNTILIPQWGWGQAGQTNMLDDYYYSPTNPGGANPGNTGPVPYRQFQFTQTAENSVTNLMFHGTDASGAILLDNVSVTPLLPPIDLAQPYYLASAVAAGTVSPDFRGGTLRIDAGETLGQSFTIEAAGGTIDTYGNNVLFSGGSITGAGGLTITDSLYSTNGSGGGICLLGEPSSYLGPTKINSGATAKLTASGAAFSTTDLTLNGSLYLNGWGQTVASLSGTDPTAVLDMGAAGAFTINGSAMTTYAGSITGSPPAPSDATFALTGAANLTLTGTSNYTGPTTLDPAATLTLGSTGAITQTASVNNSGNVILASHASLTATGSFSNSGSVVVDSAATLSANIFSQNGSGASLLNNGTITATTVNITGGVLGGNGTVNGNLTLDGGLVEGYGTITGNVTAGAGPHTIAPSAGLSPTSTGTFTAGTLTTNGNTTLSVNLVTPGTSSVNDIIRVTGANGLTINGGAIQVANTTTGAASLGYYKIMQYSGAIGGAGIANLALPDVAGSISYSLDITHDPGFIDLHRGFLGDANDDGTVNAADFAILASDFNASNVGWGGGDFNNDGVVDFADFAILSNHFGGTIGSSGQVAAGAAASGVPEPASLVLLGAGLVGLVMRRQTRPLPGRNVATD